MFALAVQVLVLRSAVLGASASCSKPVPHDLKPGETVRRNVTQIDSNPLLGSYPCDYLIHLPEGYDGSKPLPLLFYFHGWGDNDLCKACRFGRVSNEHNFIVVRPNGMQDGRPGLRSWNVGAAGRADICVHADVTETEYASCITTHNRSICNAGTCYDDVKFVSDLAASLKRELCVDDDHMYSTGGSFGAQMTYFLPPELQRRRSDLRFKAILPWYGAFYRNMLEVPSGLRGMSLFHFHGIHDTEIPMDGSEGDDSYLYVNVNTTMKRYAQINGCEEQEVAIRTRWDGRGTRGQDALLGCAEWPDCTSGARVVRCNFDGKHGIWPYFAVDMMQWFFSSLGQLTVVV